MANGLLVKSGSVLLASVLVACGQSSPDSSLNDSVSSSSPSAESGALLDCTIPNAAPLPGGGICVQILAPTSERQREASIATHPTDSNTVLVTWREGEFSVEPHIYAGITKDSGAHWNIQRLTDPAFQANRLPGTRSYGFDSTAAFGPDGTAYVLYGGEYEHLDSNGVDIYPRGHGQGMTLAVSVDDGNTWTYHGEPDGLRDLFHPD